MNTNDLKRIWNPRYPLLTLERNDLLRLGLGSLVFAAAFAIFHYLGNTVDTGKWSRSALVWMVKRWRDSGIAMGSGDYSHGFLVPLASLYVVWTQRDELLRAPKRMNALGLVFIVICLILHYLGVKGQTTRLSLLALIGLIWSVPFYFYGWQVAKRLIFPCAFLIFAVPLNFLEKLTFPLREINTDVSAAVLRGLGMDVQAKGTAIFGPPYNATAELRLDVADPCSGIRSLTAMMALTAIYGYLVMRGFWRKWILFLAGIPLAMAGNIFRIVSIGIMSDAISTDIATGLPHDYAGFIVFGIAIALMVGLSVVLNKNFKEIRDLWKRNLASARI